MVLSPNDFRDNLCDIANDLQGDDYRKIVIQSLKSLGIDEKEEIITACNRILSVLDRKNKFLEDFDKRIKKREKLKRIYLDKGLNRKDSIIYTGLPESTFDKKISPNEYIKENDGERRYTIEDLDKIARLIIDSSKFALCINTHYHLDKNRDGYLPFKGGEYFRIIEENEKFVFLYYEKVHASILFHRSKFNRYFRVKEELEL